MKLLVISHKETWPSPGSPSGYATYGGFPFQMEALSQLFDRTTLMVPIRDSSLPDGILPLIGNNLHVRPLPEPVGAGLRRKVALLTWLPRYLPCIWKEIQCADAVHTPIPSDIGAIGMVIALLQRKRLFVRHCGTWGRKNTWANRLIDWMLPRIAGGKNVVLATGGGDHPPEPGNPHIRWIFATTLTEAEMKRLPIARPWKACEPLRLVTAGRLSSGKNISSILQSLPLIQKKCPDVTLDIVGEGEERIALEETALRLGLGDRVVFHGNVSHERVLEILSQSHCFVFPTQGEGFPKVVLEALACGLPVISTDISVIPSLIRNNGRIIHDTGPESLAEAVLQITSDEKRLVEMSLRARQIAQSYTLERWQEAIGEALQQAWGEALRTDD